MKRKFISNLKIMLFVSIIAVFITGCATEKKDIDANKILNSLLCDVSYAGELTKIGDNSNLYFYGLPEDTDVEFYTVGGYSADEVALITVQKEDDIDEAEQIVKNHVKELKEQFLDYVPEEVGKIDNAIVWKSDRHIVLCITDDYDTAKAIISGKSMENNNDSSDEYIEESTTIDNALETDVSSEETKIKEYPQLQSKTGTYHVYDNTAIRVDDSAFELYTYVDSTANAYTELINEAAKKLNGEANVYVLAIPTAIGVVLPDDIAEKLPDYDNQGTAIEKIYSKLTSDVRTVNCYENMMKHRNEYLYFRTDFHWNGKGAFYAYESFCETKGVEAIPLEEHEEKVFEGFLGELYWDNSNEDVVIGNTPDSVEAYCPKSSNATMKFTDEKGETYTWNIIHDVSNYKASMKYSTFAGADNPIAIFKNSDVTDGSVCVVVKESFGNALLPFLIDHYSTIYEIDYRYWKGNLIDFTKEKQATDIIFANNLSMIRSNYLVGKLADIMR